LSSSMVQAAVTMNQLHHKMDNIAHNMANSQTTGYKSRGGEFSSLIHQQMDNLDAPENAQGRLTPDGVRVGSGARMGATNIDLSQGTINQTDRALDTALTESNQLFQIQVTSDGTTETFYTRDGAFYLSPINADQDVMLTTSDGYPVLGEDGPIIIDSGFTGLEIRPNGEIAVNRDGTTENEARIEVVETSRPYLLESAGSNLFRLPDLDELGYGFGDIIEVTAPEEDVLQSSALEQSNVNLAAEMSDLILAQRSYQMNARSISMSDQMMGLVNQLRS